MRRENILCFMKNLQKISRTKDLPRASGFFGATTKALLTARGVFKRVPPVVIPLS
jgi:hypothetical protein